MMILRLGVMRGIKQAKILLNAEQKSLLLLVASLLPNFSSGRSHFSLKFEPRLSPEFTPRRPLTEALLILITNIANII
jgi:hypothetical protein